MIKQLNPVLTPPASQILSSYYQAQRVIASRNKARTTVRLLDSLIRYIFEIFKIFLLIILNISISRLSQGHARLMFHKEVQVTDAIIAVILIEASLQGASSLLELNDMNADFPENPSIFQSALNMVVLEKLNLMHLFQIDESERSMAPSSVLDYSETDEREKQNETIHSDCGNSSTEMQQDNDDLQNQRDRERKNDEQEIVLNRNFVLEKPKNAKPKRSNKSSVQNILQVADVTADEDLSSDISYRGLSVLQKSTADEHKKQQKDGVTSKVKGNLNNFRFKPRDVTVETSSVSNNVVDINRMLNMIPSVAEDFDMEEFNLGDVSQQSFTLDDD